MDRFIVDRRLALVSVVFRLLSALLLRTYGPPDEYFQGPEIAHKWVFGIGYDTWEWWPTSNIRSSLHPAIISLVYAPLSWFGVDRPWIVELAPRVQQACVTSMADIATFHLAARLYKDMRVALYAWLLHLFHHFGLFAGARPFSNSLEWALFAVGLAAWVDVILHVKARTAEASSKEKGDGKAIHGPVDLIVIAAVAASLSVVLRPSAAVPWAILGWVTVLQVGTKHAVRLAALQVAPVALLVFLATSLMDRVFFGRWVFPAWTFFHFNAFTSLSSLYGTHPPLWYVTAGLPVVAGALLPLAAAGLYFSHELLSQQLTVVALGTIACLSAVPHKEQRFLLPLMPLLATWAGRAVVRAREGMMAQSHRSALVVLLLINVSVASYLNLWHQRGPVAAAHHVARLTSRYDDGPNGTLSLHWLMECHSAPMYAVVHRPILMLQLDCSPGARVGHFPGKFRERICAETGCCSAEAMPLLSETDVWKSNPMQLLQAMYGDVPLQPVACGTPAAALSGNDDDVLFATRPVGWARGIAPTSCNVTIADKEEGMSVRPEYRQLPSHLALFDTDVTRLGVSHWLSNNGYSVDKTFFHAFVLPGRGDDAQREKRNSQGTQDPSRLLLWRHRCWVGAEY